MYYDLLIWWKVYSGSMILIFLQMDVKYLAAYLSHLDYPRESEHHMCCNRHSFSLKQHIPPLGELLSAEVSLSCTGVFANRDMLFIVSIMGNKRFARLRWQCYGGFSPVARPVRVYLSIHLFTYQVARKSLIWDSPRHPEITQSRTYIRLLWKYIKQMYDCQQAFCFSSSFLGNALKARKGMITLTNPYITTKLPIPTHNQSRFIDLFKFPYWTNKSTAAIMTETMSLTVCATATPVNPNIACMIYRQGISNAPCRRTEISVARKALPAACRKLLLR